MGNEMRSMQITYTLRDYEYVPGGIEAREQVDEKFRDAVFKAAQDFYEEHRCFFTCEPT